MKTNRIIESARLLFHTANYTLRSSNKETARKLLVFSGEQYSAVQTEKALKLFSTRDRNTLLAKKKQTSPSTFFCW